MVLNNNFLKLFFIFLTSFFSIKSIAATVSVVNATRTVVSSSTTKVYVATKGTGACASNISTYPSGITIFDGTDTTNGILYFDVLPDDTVTAINDGVTPTNDYDVSLMVSLDTDPTNGIVLVPPSGSTWSQANSYYVPYGIVNGVTKRIGISLPNQPTYPNHQDGLCSHVTTVTDCQLDADDASVSLTLRIGAVKYGDTLSATNADYKTITIIMVSCPPRARSGVTLDAPDVDFTLTPRDGAIKVTNNYTQPYDPIELHGTVIAAAKSNTNPTLVADFVKEFDNSLGSQDYIIEGMENERQYCVSIGYTNMAGLVSLMPNPSSPKCITPSYVDGFMNRSTCFIASAAYGNEWDSRLNILRKFRDNVLLKTKIGVAFVNWYYQWSPSAAHWLWENDFLRPTVRILLIPIVGVASASLFIISQSPILILSIISFFLFLFFIFRKKLFFFIFIYFIFTLPIKSFAAIETEYKRPVQKVESAEVQPHIEALLKGKELEPKYKKTVDKATGLALVTSNDFTVSSRQVQANKFDNVYHPNDKYNIGLDIFYESQLMRNKLGALGLVSHLTLISCKGRGVFTKFQTTADDIKYVFMAVPLSFGGSYRLNTLRYFVPFVNMGLAGVPYLERRSDNKPMRRAIGASFQTVLGFAISLDWIHRKSAWDMYESNEVLHSYFTFQRYWLRSFAGPVGFDYTASYAGITFEF